jgi:hypothetical protein
MASRGIALPLALLLCVALGFVIAGAATMALTSGRIAVNFDAYQASLDAAEGGLDRGVELLSEAYEAGATLPDTLVLVPGDSLNGLAYDVLAYARREAAGRDLNGNGVQNEVVRYNRAWGYPAALASGATPADQGEPMRLIVSRARAVTAAEKLVLEAAFERDPAVADPNARGAWRAIPLRWSALVDTP